MIEAGSHGICILANWSEQFVLTDEERERVIRTVLEHVAGRVPVIVTTTHFGSQICAERSRRAEEAGAAMVMVMPPYHGATIRVPEPEIYDFFNRSRTRLDPGDDPGRAGGRHAALGSAAARMAREIENISLLQDRSAASRRQAAGADRGGDAIVGPWDGEEAITLMADLDAGATGAMTAPAIRTASAPSWTRISPATARRPPPRTSAGCR